MLCDLWWQPDIASQVQAIEKEDYLAPKMTWTKISWSLIQTLIPSIPDPLIRSAEIVPQEATIVKLHIFRRALCKSYCSRNFTHCSNVYLWTCGTHQSASASEAQSPQTGKAPAQNKTGVIPQPHDSVGSAFPLQILRAAGFCMH